MKIKDGFELREMCGEHIIIGTGMANIDFSKVISLNESAAYLWHAIEGKEFTVQLLAELLTEQYDIDDATATADASMLAKQWVNVGIVEE